MHFSLEQLRAFSLAAELGSFSAAARKMGKAQSVVSTSVNNLELDLGVALFDRSRRYPELTREGQALLEEARFILARSERLSRLAHSMLAGEEDRLSLAVDEQALVPELAEVLAEFQTTFPDLALEILHPVSQDVVTLLAEQRVDLGVSLLLQKQLPTGLDAIPLGNCQLVSVAAPTHALATQEALETQQYAAYPQIMVKSRRGLADKTLQLSPMVWSTESAWTAAELIKKGNWWGVLPYHAVADSIQRNELVVLKPLSVPSVYHQPVELLFRSDRSQGPAASWLRERLVVLYQQKSSL